MAGDKRRQHDIHDHQVGYFASKNGLSPDLTWELILKHGNSRKAVIEAAQGLKGTGCNSTETPADKAAAAFEAFLDALTGRH
ncbi:hypothetical protein ASD99_29405 [Mesorhizobium sp. Root695]|jgi:hypothetical protein|uniref:hypothetical protein n=1 Tax=Mesorhizobium sp. Root695 TaxID=1736589 RepID=UPI00070A8BE2|nr:hypothetical protein [Mesorhizobium sp. Root695]KRB24071.1 hypothetical protein ASD99_29405 [Mesorhizobium sp. Root695]